MTSAAFVAGLAVVAGATTATAAAGGTAAGARVQVGPVPALPAGARLTGSVPASTPIHLSIALGSRDPRALQSFATAVSTPGSSVFHRYLSVGQFAGRYGATDTAMATVQASLRSDGLSVGQPMANHLTLDVSGTAAQVERAFGTSLSQVTLPGGRTAYANTTAPTLPPAVAADIQGVVGLNNLVTEHPATPAAAHSLQPAPSGSIADAATAGPQPCANASAVAGGYTADLIAGAYGFSSLYGAGDLGAGQTIALYELQPYNPTDVSTYQSCYGTSTSITNVGVDSPPPFMSGDDDGEAALDIDQLIGLAPDANIIVYDAPNNSAAAVDEYSTIVSQDQAKVISSSWGICEAAVLGSPEVQSENTLFQEAAAQGQSLYVASGDTGSAACDQTIASDTALSVSDPAAQPFATGVGGTTLFTENSMGIFLWSPGNPVDQSVWNDQTLIQSTGSASGGGISSIWAMPSYQSGAAKSVGVINANSSGVPCGQAPPSLCREVPDVSANGDPATGYVVFANGAWQVIAGTSAAAPLWAAFTGLVNADSSCRGTPVGFVNPALYRLAGSAYASNISDITPATPSPITGATNNDALGVNGGLFPVGTGYDMATGLGAPISPKLAASLCGIFTITVANPGAHSGTVGRAQTLQIHATDSGGVPVTYAATGLPAGLAINPSTGLISGTPTTAQVAAVKVSARDKFTNTGATSFTWTIARPPLPPSPPPPRPPPPPPPPPPPKPVCTVPNVKGKSLAAARRTLRSHHCAVGRVKSPHKPKRSPGKHKKWAEVVKRESPPAGRTEPAGSKVALTLVWKAVKR